MQLTEEEAKERSGGRLPRFVPGPDDDPVSAERNDLQGREIIGVLREATGDMALVAEIMGNMPDYIRRAIDDLAVEGITALRSKHSSTRIAAEDRLGVLLLSLDAPRTLPTITI